MAFVPKQFIRQLSSSASSHQNFRRKVCIVGGGSWGSAIAKMVGGNVTKHADLFREEVMWYVRDDRLRLTIEKTRENIRYLPKVKLPPNVRALSSLAPVVQEADILIFAVPCEYLHSLCHEINEAVLGGTPRNPIGISLSKGLLLDAAHNLERPSQVLSRMLGIPVGVISGANVAQDVGKEEFCEATFGPPLPLHPPRGPDQVLVGIQELSDGETLDEAETGPQPRVMGIDAFEIEMCRSLFVTDYFHVQTCSDSATVELCGALANVIACGAGLVDGLGLGINTKVAALRCGLREVIKFVALFNPDYRMKTFLENCGIADMIATAFAGRNQRVACELVKSDRPIGELEVMLLGGQKPQGPNTAQVVFRVLERRGELERFPLLVAIHRILTRQVPAVVLVDAIKASSQISDAES